MKDGKAVADNVTIVARSGTGVVTRALASALPERVFIIATDLNQAMLDQATADCTANLIQQAEVGGWARRGLQVFVFVT